MGEWSDSDLAYFAGILDGEGYFSLKSRGGHRFGTCLAVGNTDLRLVQWLHARFGGTVQFRARVSLRQKDEWRWVAKAADMERLILAVLPYLKLKREQAELMLAYRLTVAPAKGRTRSTSKTPEAFQHARLRIREQITDLNRRGKAVSA